MADETVQTLQTIAAEFGVKATDQRNRQQILAEGGLLEPFDKAVVFGEEVERKFAEAASTLGDDADYRRLRGRFLSMFGKMYVHKLDFDEIERGQPIHCAYAQKAAELFYQSFQQSDYAWGADGLARLFFSVGYYASAIYWFEEVERSGKGDSEFDDLANEARMNIEKLRSDQLSLDPPFTSSVCFPTEATPGILAQDNDASGLCALLGEREASVQLQKWVSQFAKKPEVSKHSDEYSHTYAQEGVELGFNNNNRLRKIFLHRGSSNKHQQYRGILPYGLTWDDRRANIESRLGTPEKTGGGLVQNGKCIISFWADYERLNLHVTYETCSSSDYNSLVKHIGVVSFKQENDEQGQGESRLEEPKDKQITITGSSTPKTSGCMSILWLMLAAGFAVSFWLLR